MQFLHNKHTINNESDIRDSIFYLVQYLNAQQLTINIKT